MIESPLISYGFSHHLLHQAAELAPRLPGYRVVTPSFFSAATVTRARALLPPLGRLLARRSHPSVPASVAKTYPVEQLYQFASRLARRPYSYFRAHDRMARRIVRDFAPPRVLIAIDTGAESLFRAWRGRTRLVLDLTIATAPYRAKIFSEAEASPAHPGVRFHHPGAWELERYSAETELADIILCPSEFVMESCRHLGVPESRLRLLGYGFDPGLFRPAAPGVTGRARASFRVVFAGSFCHRKGSHLLLDAFARLRASRPEVELHVFGHVIDPPKQPTPGVVFHGRVPQPVLAERLREMDVMAFPTLFEGSAYVVYQALASGLPVITTRNAGSIVDPSCGLVLPEISSDALLSALQSCHDDRARLAALAAAAPRAAGRYTWAHYGERLRGILSADTGLSFA